MASATPFSKKSERPAVSHMPRTAWKVGEGVLVKINLVMLSRRGQWHALSASSPKPWAFFGVCAISGKKDATPSELTLHQTLSPANRVRDIKGPLPCWSEYGLGILVLVAKAVVVTARWIAQSDLQGHCTQGRYVQLVEEAIYLPRLEDCLPCLRARS